MADTFLGEIRAVGFNFAPTGWAMCDGQLLPISQNTALFSLLGTNFGGDGRSTFALPNLEGAVPIGQGQGAGLSLRQLGDTGGRATVTLTASETPTHGHGVSVVGAKGNQTGPTNGYPAEVRGSAYGRQARSSMGAETVSTVGGQPHDNMAPYLVVNFIIALQGIFPSRS